MVEYLIDSLGAEVIRFGQITVFRGCFIQFLLVFHDLVSQISPVSTPHLRIRIVNQLVRLVFQSVPHRILGDISPFAQNLSVHL